MKAKEALILRTISHEFRNPLNTICNLTELLLDEYEDTPASKKLNIIKDCSSHLSQIINGLIGYCEEDSDPTCSEGQKKPLNFKLLLAKVKTAYSFNANKNSILIRIDDNFEKYDLVGDPLPLIKALNNIINNAVSYTKNGEITIELELVQKTDHSITTMFKIIDSKTGVDQDQRDALYNEKFILESSENNEFNLGYHLIKKAIHQCKGEIIKLPNCDGAGEFVFEVAFEKNNFETYDNSEREKIYQFSTILLVDDNKFNRVLTKKILNKYNLDCDLAKNGLEAVKMAENKDYDIILMDIMMPIMNGIKATELIKAKKPKSKIIAVTAVSELQSDINLFDDIVSKPIIPSNLLERMETVFVTATD